MPLHPVSSVTWVDREKVRPNSYNPNAQDSDSHSLLVHSILSDGWTQPIVVTPPDGEGIHTIVDGEHRWKASAHLIKQFGRKVPVVILRGDRAGCMAATVRHNRARGSHGVEDMARIIRDALDAGETREAIIRNLGMTDAEYDRLLTSEAAFMAIQGGRDKAMSA